MGNEKLPIFHKRNLDSNIGNCIIILTEPTTPLIFHAQLGGTFLFMGCFMYCDTNQLDSIKMHMNILSEKNNDKNYVRRCILWLQLS